MQPKISGKRMFFAIAKDISDTMKNTYFKVWDVALVFEIKNKILSTKEGTMPVIENYNTLNGLWLELDYYQSIKM